MLDKSLRETGSEIWPEHRVQHRALPHNADCLHKSGGSSLDSVRCVSYALVRGITCADEAPRFGAVMDTTQFTL